MSKEQEKSAIKWGKIFKFFIIIVAALIIGMVVFFAFKIHIDAKAALRDAKNIRLALRTADIEMYAKDKTVYNPSAADGIEVGVKAKVEQIVQSEGRYRITNYSYRTHEVTGMIYERGDYRVTFIKDGDNIYWDVDYIFNVYHFDGAEE